MRAQGWLVLTSCVNRSLSTGYQQPLVLRLFYLSISFYLSLKTVAGFMVQSGRRTNTQSLHFARHSHVSIFLPEPASFWVRRKSR